MSQLGSYITNEYSILKQIFNYLLPRDLLAASQVCKEWKIVAQRIINNFQGPLSYVVSDDKPVEFNRKLIPKVVIYFNCLKCKRKAEQDKVPIFSQICDDYCVENTEFYTVLSDYSLATNFHDGICQIQDSLTSQSVFLLGDKPGVTVRPFFRVDHPYVPDTTTLPNPISKDVKCFVLFGSTLRGVNAFLGGMPNRNVIMAGGISKALSRHLLSGSHEDVTMFGISFEGENVEGHSAVHNLKLDLDEFLQEFAERVGPQPEKSIRIAFIFMCINRLDMFNEIESQTFSKYFPNIPVYGFWSLGEYCLNGKDSKFGDEPSSKKKKSILIGFYQECTSYLVVTMKNQKR